jgi:phosphohistidine phosphatase
MKKLLLIRHAKASHETNTGDFARPLKHSGEKDALELAKKIKSADLIPQKVFSSPALRAKTTALIITEHLELPEATYIEAVYEAYDPVLLKVINTLPNEYDFIALAGHNPGLSSITTYLTGKYCSLPTCGAVLISFDIESWALASTDTGDINWQHEPND